MEANGNGDSVAVSASPTRTFLCLLTVTEQMEQESLDVSIYGSADGTTWTSKPLLKLPQQFYRGHAKMVLDVSLRRGWVGADGSAPNVTRNPWKKCGDGEQVRASSWDCLWRWISGRSLRLINID